MAAKFQQKASDSILGIASMTMGIESDGISLVRQEAEEMSHITTHDAHQQHLLRAQGVQGVTSLQTWVFYPAARLAQ